jgi:hypothetical protein
MPDGSAAASEPSRNLLSLPLRRHTSKREQTGLKRRAPPSQADPDAERSLFKGLEERRFVQWVLACSAGAWLIYEATGTAVDVRDVPLLLVRTVHVLLIAGLFITPVIARYHGAPTS